MSKHRIFHRVCALILALSFVFCLLCGCNSNEDNERETGKKNKQTEEKVEKEHNFKKDFEDMLKEETIGFHPELKELLASAKEKEEGGKVQDLIDKAKANVEKGTEKEPQRELEPSM